MTIPPCTEAVKMFSPFFSETCLQQHNDCKFLIAWRAVQLNKNFDHQQQHRGSRDIVSLKTRPDTRSPASRNLDSQFSRILWGLHLCRVSSEYLIFLKHHLSQSRHPTQEIWTHNFLVDCPCNLLPAWSADLCFVVIHMAPSTTHNNNPDTQLPFKKARLWAAAALLLVCPTVKCIWLSSAILYHRFSFRAFFFSNITWLPIGSCHRSIAWYVKHYTIVVDADFVWFGLMSGITWLPIGWSVKLETSDWKAFRWLSEWSELSLPSSPSPLYSHSSEILRDASHGIFWRWKHCSPDDNRRCWPPSEVDKLVGGWGACNGLAA